MDEMDSTGSPPAAAEPVAEGAEKLDSSQAQNDAGATQNDTGEIPFGPEENKSLTASGPLPLEKGEVVDLAGQRVKAGAKVRMHKQARIEKILNFVMARGTITNDQAQKVAGVSDATATRYLQELELASKIKQVGKTGHAVTYERAG